MNPWWSAKAKIEVTSYQQFERTNTLTFHLKITNWLVAYYFVTSSSCQIYKKKTIVWVHWITNVFGIIYKPDISDIQWTKKVVFCL